MNRMVLKSRVGADGVLNVSVPLGAADAGLDVQVIIAPLAAPLPNRDEWTRWVHAMGESVCDPTFRRHVQGDFEPRESLP